MLKYGEKITHYLYNKIGATQFESFVKVLITQQLMSEEDFGNLSRAFKKKKPKASSGDFRRFLKQAKQSTAKQDMTSQVLVAKPNQSNVDFEVNPMLNQSKNPTFQKIFNPQPGTEMFH